MNIFVTSIYTAPVHLGGTAHSNAYFDVGSGPIFLDDVQCVSSSSQLLECPSMPILSHNCLHSADAGVVCKGIGQISTTEKFQSGLTLCVATIIYIAHLQLRVQMVSCDWQEVTLPMKAEWRSA